MATASNGGHCQRSQSCSKTQRDAQILSQQLQHALDSRVTIEQAKGILAERSGLSNPAGVRTSPLRPVSHRRIIDVAGDVIHAGLTRRMSWGPHESGPHECGTAFG